MGILAIKRITQMPFFFVDHKCLYASGNPYTKNNFADEQTEVGEINLT